MKNVSQDLAHESDKRYHSLKADADNAEIRANVGRKLHKSYDPETVMINVGQVLRADGAGNHHTADLDCQSLS